MDFFQRLFDIGRAHLYDLGEGDRAAPSGDFDHHRHRAARGARPGGDARDPVLAEYYANLEIPYGSDLATVRAAWRRMMKKYHPDLHARDPGKRRIADELTAGLTKAYNELEHVLSGGERP